MSSLFGIAAGGSSEFYDYQIEQSLRFNEASQAYLRKTDFSGSPTSDQTGTFSVWVKNTLSYTDNRNAIYGSSTGSAAFTSLSFSGDTQVLDLRRRNTNGSDIIDIIGNPAQRDPSAWYHIMSVYDMTNATQADRAQIYVNGVRVTDLGTNTLPSNTTTEYYSGDFISDMQIGRTNTNSSNMLYADFILAEFHRVDGQALDPTSFGEFKSGVWIPKEYTGSYGNHGFHLDFADTSDIGKDVSGNGNDFTANNLSVHDVVPDSPTVNYAVVNPLARSAQDPRVTLSEGNLNISAVTNSDSNFNTRFATIPLPSSGKYYAECRAYVISSNGNQTCFGVVDPAAFDANEPSSKTLYNFADGEGFDGFNMLLNPNTAQAYSDGATSGSQITGLTATSYILKLALDIDNGKVFVGYDGVWLNSADPAAGSGEIATRTFTTSDVIAIQTVGNASGNNNGSWLNFGQDSTFGGNVTAGGNSDDNGYGDFAYAVPSGFLALNSANLPEPAITALDDDIPEDYFNTVLYTGNGSTQSITGVGFQPDWTWVKSRNVGGNHILQDAVRGVGKGLFSDLTNAENASMGGMTSFDSDGFSLDGSVGELNANTRTFAAWNWKAGSTAVSNTDGSITSSVSANTKAGFSIVSFAVPASGTFTIGHGLGTKPAMIITKGRDSADNWVVYHKSISTDENTYILLNKSDSSNTATDIWGTAQPTTTVMGMKAGTTLIANQEAIAYCFAEVEGYSKFGSYTGNGSTDGTFIYTGFRPSLVMIKDTSTSNRNWNILDSTRSPSNLANTYLNADTNGAEATFTYLDFTSNGIKLRNSSSGNSFNYLNDTYLYMAFAEMPFKYANAR